MTGPIPWPWFWVGVGLVIAPMLPLLVAGRFRLGYASALCVLLSIVIAFFGLRNLHSVEWISFVVQLKHPHAEDHVGGIVEFGAGGMMLFFDENRSEDRESVSEPREPPHFDWSRDRERYPECRDPVFRRWGFQVTWLAEKPRPGFSWVVHMWAFICPFWFPILFLMILPSVYAHRRWWRPWRRRRLGLCPRCGMDLRGSPDTDAGKRCPECGAMVKSSSEWRAQKGAKAFPTGEDTVPAKQNIELAGRSSPAGTGTRDAGNTSSAT
jgi:hypothetical protein